MKAAPQLLAWITCDAVHFDPATGKHTLLGVFSNIQGRHFPISHPRMVWFLTITDCPPGDHRLKVSFGFDPTALQPLIERPFASPGPLQRINLINEIHQLAFPRPGDYSILIEIDDEPLLATSLNVTAL